MSIWPDAARLTLALLTLALFSPVHALEYSSTARAALLYDTPSTAGTRVAVAGAGLPLEIVVDTDAWAKVRDPGGRLAWIEKAVLGGPRNVMVKSEVSDIRQAPRGDAEVVFRAARGVLLQVTGEARTDGWLPVRHVDGLAGWLPAFEVWGQ